MKARSSFFLVIAVTVLLFTYDSAVAGTEEIDKVETAADVISEIMDIPEKGMPVTLLRNAYGIAIVPGVIKVGFVLGGRYGKGILLIQDNKDEWSNPSFITLTGGSVGWQIGARSTDIILVFKNRKSIKGIIKGKFTLGADAAIAAGPVGRQERPGQIFSSGQKYIHTHGVAGSLRGLPLREQRFRLMITQTLNITEPIISALVISSLKKRLIPIHQHKESRILLRSI